MKLTKTIVALLITAVMTLQLACPILAYTDVTAGHSKEEALELPGYDEDYHGKLEEAKQQDWYKFTTKGEDGYYKFNLMNINIPTSPNGNHYDSYMLNIWLYNDFNQQIGHAAADYNSTSSFSIKLDNSTTYWFKIAMGNYYDSQTGDYFIKLLYTRDVAPDSMDCSYSIDLDTNISASMDGTNDRDWYKITTKSEDHFYRVCISNINIATSPNSNYYDSYRLNVWLYNDLHQLLGHMAADKNSTNSFSLKLSNDTEYYICVGMGSNYKTSTGEYTIEIISTRDEIPDSRADAYQIEFNTDYYQTMDGTGDVDYYKIELSLGATYRIWFNNINIPTSPNSNYYDSYRLNIWLYNEDGNERGHWALDRDSGWKYGTIADVVGTYYIKVAMGSNFTTSTGRYAICVDEEIPHFVTFVDWDGTVLDKQLVEYGKDAVPPTAPEREGHTFTGWDGDYTNVVSEVTITAQYEINTYTVKFRDWNGAILSEQKVEYGQAAVAPDEPIREGYTFKGWDKDFSCIKEDMLVSAVYEINTFTVTFKDGLTGEEFATQTVDYNTDVNFPEAPVHEGYRFIGWDSDGKNIKEDTTITASYEEIIYHTVTFTDGLTGETISTATVEHGADAVFPTAPTHEGYTFTGWDSDGTNITSDTTITALYEEIVVPTPTPTTEPTPTPTADPTPTPTTEPELTTGDLSGDGKINTADAVFVLKAAAGMIQLDEKQSLAGDCNHDGKVNTADAVLILKYSAGMITSF